MIGNIFESSANSITFEGLSTKILQDFLDIVNAKSVNLVEIVVKTEYTRRTSNRNEQALFNYFAKLRIDNFNRRN